MGRYPSGSDEEREREKKKKKKKRRSRSRSRSASMESRQSSKKKKSKKKKKKHSYSRSVSRSPDPFGRNMSRDRYKSRSRSCSYGRRSRSRSRDKYRRRSRSPSRGRYSRSRSRERRRRRSRSYESGSRSSRRSRSRSASKKSKRKSKEREDPCLSIPGFTEMAPNEQAKIRMQMALKAAAAADEKIKGDNRSSSSTSLHDSLLFSQAVQDIESSGFIASSFKSSRGDKKEEKMDTDAFTFGTAGELRLDTNKKPVILDVDNEELAHPSLYGNPEERLDKWIQRLTLLRRRKLEGEALS